MSNILIAGGTGLIGKQLSRMLREKGHQISLLSRKGNPDAEFPTYEWNIMKGKIDIEALDNVDYIINLAGAGVADEKWTKQRKKLLIDSRTHGAATIAKYIVEGEVTPKAYISASANGFYGNRGNETMHESSGRGEGFLADCTVAWEGAIENLSKTGVRTVGLRIGIVLTPQGGALEKILMPFKFGTGNWFGKGNQYYSWIHIDDVCSMFIHALENESMNGFYNATSPNPVTNKELVYAIKEAKGKNYLMMPAPPFALRLAMGEMADIVLHGNRVSPKKIMDAGFQFKHPDIVPALKDLLK